MEKELVSSLYMSYKKVQILFASIAEQMGLDPAPLLALKRLWDQDGLTITELSDKLFLKASTITSLIDRMERDGLVHRERNQDDRRVVRVYLTNKAKELKEQYPGLDRLINEKIAGKMSDKEIENLVTLLKKLETLL
ncbi:hypothetical protein JCM14036_05230 [Desulfotomaculum defluvii]